MARSFLAATAAMGLLILALSAACGGSDDSSPTPTPAASTTAPTSTGSDQGGQGGLLQPPVVEQAIPTPTRLPDLGIVVTVKNGSATFLPKRAEMADLASTEVKAGDKSYTGITLQTFADRVQAKPSSFVRVTGVRSDGKRIGFVQGTLSEIGSSTLFVTDSTGHLSLVSSTVPSDQWVTAVESIIFQ